MATRPASPTDHRDLSGALIAGRYRVRRTLGRGPIGTVSLCRAVWNDALVAVKLLHPELAAVPATASAFVRAAQALAQLEHPNIVAIFESGADDALKLPYFAMEYVDGRDLTRVIAEDWPLSDARVVDIMSQVLRALSRAHELGVLHLGLKLNNIMLPQRRAGESAAERVVVSDFGFAPLAARPENTQTDAPDERSDIYAAGVVLFQLLTRTPPFDAADPFDVQVQHRATAEPAWIGEVHPALQAACLKALSKSPDARYQSADEMRTALEAALERASVPGGLAPVRSLAPDVGVSVAAAPQPHRLAPRPQLAPRNAEPKPAPQLVYGDTARMPRRMSSLAPAERVVTKAPVRDVIPKRHTGRWLLAGVALLIAIWTGLARLPRSGPWASAHSALPPRASGPSPNKVAGDPLAVHRDDTLAPALAGAICDADAKALAAPSQPLAAASPVSQPPRAEAAPSQPSATPSQPTPSAAGPASQPPSVETAPSQPQSVAQARVAFGSTFSPRGLSRTHLNDVIDRTALTDCYRAALRAGHASNAAFDARLDIQSLRGRRIGYASLRGAQLPTGLKACVEGVALSSLLPSPVAAPLALSATLTFQAPP